MILIVFFGMVGAIVLVFYEFAEEIANFKMPGGGNIKNMYDQIFAENTGLKRELNQLRGDYDNVRKQLTDNQDKESEFITRIFEQRKEIDLKNEENKSLIEANKNLQDRVGEQEKLIEVMHKQQEKMIVEFKRVKEERADLAEEVNRLKEQEEELKKEIYKRKKTAATVAD